MLSAERIAEVRRLLHAVPEISHRKIARIAGVSRGTVGAVASGQRPEYESRPKVEEDRPQGPPARCHGCGGLVYMPCRLCLVRAVQAKERERRIARRNPLWMPPRTEPHCATPPV